MKVKLINYTPEPEKTIAMAAKLCYSPVGTDEIEEKLTEEGIKKFIKMITDIGHGSVLEHVSFMFSIEGISRACANQIVRHRIASYSQQSLRYVDVAESFDYIIPKEIAKDTKLKKLYEEMMEQAKNNYNFIYKRLLKKKVAIFLIKEKKLFSQDAKYIILQKFMQSEYKSELLKFKKESLEDARCVLPLSTETKIIVTMNARSLFNFFEHRCCNRAQEEIRDLATEMLKEVKKVAPILFDKAGASCVNGKCPEKSMSCGKMEEVKEKFECL